MMFNDSPTPARQLHDPGTTKLMATPTWEPGERNNGDDVNDALGGQQNSDTERWR